ncbi:MAG: acetyl-CoA carboxylase biotin carboxylase subunit [Armatimonadetes bacterium]|nr:acetyl-CoA carboxylase biotin carboxylase subunit [Armatimonadota bacterium]
MFKKILVANRGEIALRIIRACRELNIKTVAVFSEIDRNSLHVNLADEAYCIGPAPAILSYLNIPNIISAALLSKSAALHPGYGFLAENSKFAEICESHGIKFIGPSAKSMNLLGDKAKAREFLKEFKIPILPGTKILKKEEDANGFLKEHNFPVIIKASAGGGGKGMRVVFNKEEFAKSFNNAKLEAKSSFGDERIYLEKFLAKPRHIEFQILADIYNNIVHLGDRDCSVQRRKQKIIEESPTLPIAPHLKAEMAETACRIVSLANYNNCGTIEFLFDEEIQKFYFLEMNTRIQVEHPVTEMVTGIDLIKEQIKISAGYKLNFSQREINFSGHAIECRINAEDPEENFIPQSGKISSLILPGGLGIRVDTGIFPGCEISPFYDSLLAKLIVHGKTREEAISKMQRALSEFQIGGIKTNLPLQRYILNSHFFQKAEFHTNFIEEQNFINKL